MASSARADRRPVVAIDVDEVVNAVGQGRPQQVTILPEHRPDSPFLAGRPGVAIDLTVCVDPATGPWITALREHADVIWATTWEAAANVYLAPLLGIDPLPTPLSVAAVPPRLGYVKDGDSLGWKREHLIDAYPGRPLCWLDDGAWRQIPEVWDLEGLPAGQVWWDWRTAWIPPQDPRRLDAAPTLVIAPDPRIGLTPADRARVTEWVADPWGTRLSPRRYA